MKKRCDDDDNSAIRFGAGGNYFSSCRGKELLVDICKVTSDAKDSFPFVPNYTRHSIV